MEALDRKTPHRFRPLLAPLSLQQIFGAFSRYRATFGSVPYPGFMFSSSNIPGAPFFAQMSGIVIPPTIPAIPSFLRSPSLGALSHTGSPFQGHLNQTCTMRLTRDNFLLWKYTILPIVKGHKLDGFLFGTIPRPPNTNLYTGVSNHATDEWDTVDKLLIGWLLSSMTDEALVEVMGCSTSHEIWTTLETLFNSQSEARMLEFKSALTKSEKGSKYMSDYLAQMKSYNDSLAAAGYPVSKSELILATLGGLDKDYEVVIVNITSRVGSLTWPEVQSQLLTQERLLARFNPTINLTNGAITGQSNPSAHLVAYGSGSSPAGRPQNRNNNNSSQGMKTIEESQESTSIIFISISIFCVDADPCSDRLFLMPNLVVHNCCNSVWFYFN